MNNEIGKELTAAQLTPKTIVVIGHDGCKAYMTCWVASIETDFVAFLLGEVNTTFLARRMPDDTLRDDSGKHIRVFEYLGEA